jgi:predicted CXXCH cytochrome family protein
VVISGQNISAHYGINKMKPHGMAGLLSVSALAVGFASNAYAFHIASDVVTGIASDVSGSVFAPSSAINITYSRHNLGTTNKLGSNHTIGSSGGGPNGTSVLDSGGNVVGTNQICVFCHTPHGFNAAQAGPLWNKAVNTSATYSVYNSGNQSSTFDAATPSIGSVSLACLSCHDGTQAMDNMINGPGSGLMAADYDSAASSINASTFYISNGGGENQAYTWGDPQGGFAQMSQGSPFATGSFVNSDSPALEGILLGTDLSNDHPISMQYCGGGISSYLNSNVNGGSKVAIARGTCNDRLFNLPTVASIDTSGGMRFWVDTNVIADSDAIAAGSASTGGTGAYPITRDPDTVEIYVADGVTLASNVDPTTCNSPNNGDGCGRGYVPSTTTTGFTPIRGMGIRTKQDIMLYTNNAGVSGDGGPSVECASCHDPHTPNNGTFLRVSNQGSGLCLSCHVK